MNEKDLLFFRQQLEALISEREGMVAANNQRKATGESMAYTDEQFFDNARSIRAIRSPQ